MRLSLCLEVFHFDKLFNIKYINMQWRDKQFEIESLSKFFAAHDKRFAFSYWVIAIKFKYILP